jgi:ABC-2 type transport system ATP-binding protein
MSIAGSTAHSKPPYRSPPEIEAAVRAPAIIECDGLVHDFGDKRVLRGVSFEVPKGSIFGFIGPNGAGKTTTLRILATLLDPTAGTARIAGHDVVTEPEDVRRVLGYMPDGPGVYERVTVREYLDFFASAHGIYGESRASAVARVLELTEIGPLRSTQIQTLSKGQKQRVLLGRTLLHDPLVLVLDEPASDLDPRARVELRTLLRELGRMGKTVLLSSHILTELAELCDSIGVLERGRIVVSGSIEEVEAKARPRERGSRVKLTVLDRGDEAMKLMRDCPRVVAVQPVEAERKGASAFEVTYEEDERSIAEIVLRLAKAEISICAVEPERTDLEQIFMDVTSRAAPKSAPGGPPR